MKKSFNCIENELYNLAIDVNIGMIKSIAKIDNFPVPNDKEFLYNMLYFIRFYLQLIFNNLVYSKEYFLTKLSSHELRTLENINMFLSKIELISQDQKLEDLYNCSVQNAKTLLSLFKKFMVCF